MPFAHHGWPDAVLDGGADVDRFRAAPILRPTAPRGLRNALGVAVWLGGHELRLSPIDERVVVDTAVADGG